MLYADKLALHSSLAVELLRVRDKELDYYTANMQHIATNSALLVGFAMTILSNYETSDKNWSEVTNFSLDDWRDQKNYLELVYILSTTAAIVCQLWTMINGIMATILGQGLALRGPEGSMDKAVKGMAIENQKTIHIFFIGIVFFHISIAFNALLTYHYLTALITVVALLLSLAWLIRHLCYGLLPKFYIPLDQLVDGRFDGKPHQSAGEFKRLRARHERRQAEQMSKVRSVGKLLAGTYRTHRQEEAVPARRLSTLPRVGGLGRDAVPAPLARSRSAAVPIVHAERRDSVTKPTEVAHSLMLQLQGEPLPRDTRTGALDQTATAGRAGWRRKCPEAQRGAGHPAAAPSSAYGAQAHSPIAPSHAAYGAAPTRPRRCVTQPVLAQPTAVPPPRDERGRREERAPVQDSVLNRVPQITPQRTAPPRMVELGRAGSVVFGEITSAPPSLPSPPATPSDLIGGQVRAARRGIHAPSFPCAREFCPMPGSCAGA